MNKARHFKRLGFEERKSVIRLLSSTLDDMKDGDLITYKEIAKITGVPDVSQGRSYNQQIFYAAREKSGKITITNAKEGYRLCDKDMAIEVARSTMTDIDRAVVRGDKKTLAVQEQFADVMPDEHKTELQRFRNFYNAVNSLSLKTEDFHKPKFGNKLPVKNKFNPDSIKNIFKKK